MESTRIHKLGAWVAAFGMAALLAVGLTGCSSNSSEGSGSAEGSSSDVQEVNITLKDNAVELDTDEVEAGVITFNVTNESAPGISECELLYNQKIIGEKENLAPGLDTVSFTVTLDGGDYKIYCPGADESYTDFTVTGEAAAAPEGSTQEILAQGVEEYASYIKDQGQYLEDATATLNEKVQAGDVEAAKEAWAAARPFYEHAESAVDNFLMPGYTIPEGEEADNNYFLDYLIDMRESNFDENAGWHGFHAIERDLWENGAITQETKDYAQELADNCKTLNEEVIPTFADELKPEDLANGAADLLEEVSTTKITGEEDKYSHLDLSDFRSNVEGAQQAYANLRDGLLEIDEDLVTKLDEEFQSVSDLLDTYRDDSEVGNYVPYTDELKASDSEKLSEAIAGLHDDLASLAEKVATA